MQEVWKGGKAFQELDVFRGVEVEECLRAVAKVGDGGMVPGLPGLQATFAGGEGVEQVGEEAAG